MASNIPLKFDSILHKAHIEVDRRETKAAAVSFARVVVAGAAPMMGETKSVVLDRPFIYAIMYKNTGLPMFVGTVQDLK